MNKYLIYILFGIILFILLNSNESFSIGIPAGEAGEACRDTDDLGEPCDEELYCIGGVCVAAGGGHIDHIRPGIWGRFAESCSVALGDSGPPKKSGEINRFDLWKKYTTPLKSGWDYRWFIVFNDRIEYYVGNQLRDIITYNTIREIKMVVEGAYKTLHIITTTKIHVLWAGQYLPTREDFNKLLQFTLLIIRLSNTSEISEDKVVIRIPQYWPNRGDLPGGNDALLFIFEKVYDRGKVVTEGNGLQGAQKWFDFFSARKALLDDNDRNNSLNLDEINLGLDAAVVCVDTRLQTLVVSNNTYMAYIIQESDYSDFRIPSREEMYTEKETSERYDPMYTFHQPFFDYDKKILICVTVTHNITEDILQNYQYQMGIHRSIGHVKYKYPDDNNKHDGEFHISDDGKGSSYGLLSLKLHAYSSLALIY